MFQPKDDVMLEDWVVRPGVVLSWTTGAFSVSCIRYCVCPMWRSAVLLSGDRLLSRQVLQKHICFNIHPSLLPALFPTLVLPLCSFPLSFVSTAQLLLFASQSSSFKSLYLFHTVIPTYCLPLGRKHNHLFICFPFLRWVFYL